MQARRARCLADLNIPLEAYEGACRAFIEEPPVIDLVCKAGGTLLTDYRGCSPDMIIAATPFISSMLQGGACTGVLQGCKLLQAWQRSLGKNSALLSSRSADKLANDLTNRMHHIFTMMRNLKIEDSSYIQPHKSNTLPHPITPYSTPPHHTPTQLTPQLEPLARSQV